MKKYAIIVAGGSGTRMGASIPKQFLLLHGKPILQHAAEAFLNAYPDLELILVLPEANNGLAIDFGLNNSRVQKTKGGESRFESVQNGLKLVEEDSIIFVHDAVRCLVTVGLIRRCYEQALVKGTAIPAVASQDSIRWMENDGSKALDRNRVMLVQTPQVFRGEIILPAFSQGYKEGFTDEASVVESFGFRVDLIMGEENNIKITTPVDLLIAEKLMAKT
ncbi:MAG: 2-C-methyl-D-erythritol 4-phosphate cytidylyltransferase [Chitinophagaceae bacterium]|nr:2-C-methyl-D-erythritol 4-phosphate cytidylyltransferase [Chitinophagaceae bacterium]